MHSCSGCIQVSAVVMLKSSAVWFYQHHLHCTLFRETLSGLKYFALGLFISTRHPKISQASPEADLMRTWEERMCIDQYLMPARFLPNKLQIKRSTLLPDGHNMSQIRMHFSVFKVDEFSFASLTGGCHDHLLVIFPGGNSLK